MRVGLDLWSAVHTVLPPGQLAGGCVSHLVLSEHFGAIGQAGLKGSVWRHLPDYLSVSLTLFLPSRRHQREAKHHKEADEPAQRSQEATGVIGVHKAA
jgi:hypothetical protein